MIILVFLKNMFFAIVKIEDYCLVGLFMNSRKTNNLRAFS